jgi:glucose-6-phosphate isomerase
LVVLTLYHDSPPSESISQQFVKDDVLARLKSLDARAERKGLESLDPSRNRLIPLGTEIDAGGRVTKNSYGVFHLSWRAEKAGDWHARAGTELAGIREKIRETHGTRLRFVIWAGMGGSAEDKTMFNAVGLLKKGPRLYVLDSTDPAKLKHILHDIQKRGKIGLAEALKSTLVAGQALGMTSYEPVVNLEKLYNLYEKHEIDSRPNFIYMTLAGSLLDQFASARGYRRVELQMDSGNATSGRHSGPLTRGSLYPLGLAGADLKSWIEGTYLCEREIQTAWRLSAFLQAQGAAGRDKVTLLLPKAWEGAAIWTKQDFEESLGKSEEIGIKIVVGEKPRLADLRPPKDKGQDRVFLAVQVKGLTGPDPKKVQALRRAGYPVAVIAFKSKTELSSYMQFMHYCVFGLGYLRDMNFVTQPGVELYKAITNKLHAEARKAGGIRKSEAWTKFMDPAHTVKYRGGLTLHCAFASQPHGKSAPECYANLVKRLALEGRVDHAELTFFGDVKYSPAGKQVRKRMEKAADLVFRSRLKMPADVYEGPAMNHSYHEMIIGHGKCFSTVILSEKSESIPAVGYDAEYHTAQFLATQMALAQRGRAVVAMVLKDLEAGSLAALDEFFRQVASHLKS